MGGIVGFTGTRPAQGVLIEGLSRLEYRGYDSAGVAIYQDGKNADYEKNPKAYTILHRTVKKGDVLKVKQARGGGFAVSLMKK